MCRIVTIVHQVPAPQWSDYAAQGIELQTKVHEDFIITEKASRGALSHFRQYTKVIRDGWVG